MFHTTEKHKLSSNIWWHKITIEFLKPKSRRHDLLSFDATNFCSLNLTQITRNFKADQELLVLAAFKELGQHWRSCFIVLLISDLIFVTNTSRSQMMKRIVEKLFNPSDILFSMNLMGIFFVLSWKALGWNEGKVLPLFSLDYLFIGKLQLRKLVAYENFSYLIEWKTLTWEIITQ